MIESFEMLAEDMLAGELSGPDRERFVGHLAGCADCQARYTVHEQLAVTLGTLATVPLPALSGSFTTRVLSRLPGAAPSPPPPGAQGAGFKLIAMAATLAALAACGILVNTLQRAPEAPLPATVPRRSASPISPTPEARQTEDTPRLRGAGTERARFVLMREIGALKGAGLPPDELVAQAIRNATRKHGDLGKYYKDVGDTLRSELRDSTKPIGR